MKWVESRRDEVGRQDPAVQRDRRLDALDDEEVERRRPRPILLAIAPQTMSLAISES
jgi:hypothetical protein